MGQTGDAVPIAELLDERRHLLDVAHWMLGPGPEAEDAVTETYRRWYALASARQAGIADPRTWLTRTTGIVCLARLSLPGHPLPTAAGRPDSERATRLDQALTEEISDILLHALDTLPPAERAAFVLDDVFATPSRAVVGIGGQPPRECTELADRARHGLRAARAHPTPSHQHDRIVRGVRQACSTADVAHLAALLAPGAIAFFDGGGKVRVLTRPVHGKHHVTHTLLALLAPGPHTALHLSSANGRTGIVVRHHGRVAAVISLDVVSHQVTHVWAVLNPDKLRSWNRG